MELKLEDVCIGHINPRGEDCKGCKKDEENYHCPRYLSQKDAIRLYRPEYTFPISTAPLS
jgi:hypothetical protein